MQCGYVKLWRSVIDCGLMQRPVEFTLFSYLLMRAMHEPVRYGIAGGVVDIPVGGFISSPEKLGSELSLTRQVVRTAIKNLEKMQILTTKSTNKFTLYVIDNYAKYQGANQQTNQQTNQKATINQPAVNQQLTTNIELNNINIKESKEEESINSKALAAEPPPDQSATEKRNFPIQGIFDAYNSVLGDILPKAKALTTKRRTAISSRIREDMSKRKSIDWWIGYFDHCKASDFLTGKKTDFVADFDFLTGAKMINVLEGKYHG